MTMRSRRFITETLSEVILFLIMVIMMLPIVWLIMMSLKTEADALEMPPKLFFVPTFQHYIAVFSTPGMLRALGNSAFIASASLTLALVVGIPAAYGLVRFNFKLRQPLAIAVLLTRIAPPVGMLIPFYLMYRAAGLLDTYTAMIFAHTGMNLPIVTWMMMGFFRDVPRELEEAARLDGCSQIEAFCKIVLPVTVNGIVTVGIIGFLFSWNELMFATTLTGTTTRTAPAAISNFLLYQEVKWGPLTAAAVTVIIPALAFIGFAQKHLLRGLTAGMK
jgi:multiple sugar transport system permease protein